MDASGTVAVSSGHLEIERRIGIDLDPLDINTDDDVAWLRSCIWPEHHQRRRRLDAAVSVAAAEPPHLVRGDLVDHIEAVLDHIPDGVTPVVFHSAVLAHLPRDARVAFRSVMDRHPEATWISNEAPGVLAAVTTTLMPPITATTKAHFVVASSGRQPLGIADPHGAWLRLSE